MRAKLHIAPPAVEPRVGPCGRMVDHRHRLNLQPVAQFGRKERLKQRRFERQHPQPVGAGAFGKEQQLVTRQQTVLKHLRLLGGAARVAHHEHRAGGPRQPADARPARDFGLGDEIDAFGRVQHENIQPRGVIGHHSPLPPHR